MGIRVGDLVQEGLPRQLNFFIDIEKREKRLRADQMVDSVRRRYGYQSIQRGIMYEDRYLSSLDATADDHMVHPHSYFERGNSLTLQVGAGRLLPVQGK